MSDTTTNTGFDTFKKILVSGLIPWDIIAVTVSVMAALGYVIYSYGWLAACLVYGILMIGSFGQQLVARRQLRVAAEHLGMIYINGRLYELKELCRK